MSPVDPALRRESVGDVAPGDEPELVERLRTEIRTSGPITFARFMERALYEPGLGYYTSGRPGPGREGDFLTAPTTHPVFGRAVARQLDEAWTILGRPDPFVVREQGAGSGALGLAILDGLVADGSDLRAAVRYEPVEIDGRRLAAISTRLAAAGHAAPRAASGGSFVGAVVANEVLDALPVHRVVQRGDSLRELYVTWDDGRFAELEGEPSTARLAGRLAAEDIVLRDGQRAEICLAIEDWLAGAVAGMREGIVLLVDYGHPATELYGPKRIAGSLLAYVGHRVHDDPFANVGRQDLTAHVDVTALDRAARALGLAPLGVTSQAEFLAGIGIDDVVAASQSGPAATLESALEMRSALARLLDPAVTGAFRVIGFGRGLPRGATLRGFAFRLAR